MTAPGVVVDPDMPEDVYHAHPALSSTGARRLLRTCPAVFHHEKTHGRPPRPAFDLGRAVHTTILGAGPKLAVWDGPDWRTKTAQEFRADAYQTGRVPVLRTDHQLVQGMTAAVRAHPTAARLLDLDNGTAEQSIIWTDPVWHVQRRARFDFATTAGDLPVIVDLKTSVTADPTVLGRKVAEFGYHEQAAWYLDAARAAGTEVEPAFVLVFVEKTPPHVVSVVDLDDRAITVGAERNARALEMFRDCTAAGVWPGYQPLDEVTTLSLPRWAYHDSQVLT